MQCQPATISFTSVLGTKDEDLLGDGNLAKAEKNTWLNVIVRTHAEDRFYLLQDLPSNATQWTWQPVDLPAGSHFYVAISSLTNLTSNSTSASKSKTTAKNKPVHTSVPQVVARAFFSSDVVEGEDSSCLSSATRPVSNGTDSGDPGLYGHGSHDGSDDEDDDGGSSGPNRSTVIIAALLGGLCGLFIAAVAALAWHKRRDQRRLRDLAERTSGVRLSNRHSRSFYDGQDSTGGMTGSHVITMTATNGSAAHGRQDDEGATASASGVRRSVVPLWDGGYRDGPSAGWGYMSHLAPGLAPQAPPAFTSPSESPSDAANGVFSAIRGRRNQQRGMYNGLRPNTAVTHRTRTEGEEDLPTYLKSEQDTKGLPGYDPGLAWALQLSQAQASYYAQEAAQTGNGAPRSPTEEERATLLSSGGHHEMEDLNFGEPFGMDVQSAYEGDGNGTESVDTDRRALNRSGSSSRSGTTAAFRPPPTAQVGRSVTVSSLDRHNSGGRGGGGSNASRGNVSSGSGGAAARSTGQYQSPLSRSNTATAAITEQDAEEERQRHEAQAGEERGFARSARRRVSGQAGTGAESPFADPEADQRL